ncbi:hypothetical protein BH23GEM9_BH23GEM9_32670 [soil metagenome]
MDAMTQDSAGDSLRLELQAPSSVRTREVVSFVVRVENVSTRPVDLYLRGRDLTVDIIVRDARGVEMWRRLDGAVIPAIIRLETLAAGGMLELSDEWRQTTSAGAVLPAGVYTVHGEFLTDNRPLVTPPITLRIGD